MCFLTHFVADNWWNTENCSVGSHKSGDNISNISASNSKQQLSTPVEEFFE